MNIEDIEVGCWYWVRSCWNSSEVESMLAVDVCDPNVILKSARRTVAFDAETMIVGCDLSDHRAWWQRWFGKSPDRKGIWIPRRDLRMASLNPAGFQYGGDSSE